MSQTHAMLHDFIVGLEIYKIGLFKSWCFSMNKIEGGIYYL